MNLFKDQSFGDKEGDNAKHQCRQVACRELHAKEEEGWGGGAHREWCRVEERGDKERLWVSA